MRILILGDSITKGELGFDYIHLLDGFNITAKGVNGETLFGLSEWMYDEVAKDNYDQVIIAIGHNDIILPILLTKGKMFKKPYLNLIRRGSIPTENAKEFGALYADLVKKLKEVTRAKIAITTLSLLNEDQNSVSAQRRVKYNEEIRKLSNLCDVIDIGERFDSKVQNAQTKDFFLMDSALSFVMDKLKTKNNEGSNILAEARGLFLTFDGIHLNKSGAQVYKEEIEKYLLASSEDIL